MSNWFIVKTKKSKEFWAKYNLERQNFEVYIPRIYKFNQIYNNKRVTKSPLFPGYLFVKSNSIEKYWMTINNTLGVNSIISFSNQIPKVPNKYIDNLMSLEDEDGLISIIKLQKLVKGRICKILNGPFSGLDGVIDKVLSKTSIILTLKFLGKDLNIKLPKNYIAVN